MKVLDVYPGVARVLLAPSTSRDRKKTLAPVYTKFADEALKDGVLSPKFKGLSARALPIADSCKPCPRRHSRRTLELGATTEEVAEGWGVPSSSWGPSGYLDPPSSPGQTRPDKTQVIPSCKRP